MKKFLFLVIIILVSKIYSQDVIDKVVAVVDNEVITESELDYQLAVLAAQQKVNTSDPNVQKQVLNSMVEEKLLYAQAQLDSITVTDDEVNRHVENRINMIVQQYGSKEKVEQLYGMSIEKIKREFQDDARKYLMAENLKRTKFGNIEANSREVEEFFEQYKDSLGLIPEKYNIGTYFYESGSK